MRITIDGPAGVGKSTVAKFLSRKLKIPLLETGKIYRAVAFALTKEGRKAEEATPEDALSALKDITISPEIGETKMFYRNHHIGKEIQKEEVGNLASVIGAFPSFREAVNEMFRKVSGPDIIAEGRDAGTHIFPEAEVKIFLIASIEERARRRLKDLKKMGVSANLGEIIAQIEERDRRDETRDKYPFVPARDAIIIDTTGKGVDEVIEEVLSVIRIKMG